MRTAVISDLHLGLGGGADLLRGERFREPLIEALVQADRLILLGDVLELRDRPLAETLETAAPVLAALGGALSGSEIVVVPGNHDHHLIEPWHERRALDGAGPPELEQQGEPEGRAFAALTALLAPAAVSFAYPGLWIRPDVYAIHGHYLDRHLTVPTIERLGVAMVERVLGIAADGPESIEPTGPTEVGDRIEEYERIQTPVYALLYALAQASVGERRGGGSPSIRIWRMLGGGETRSAKLRGWLLGAVAVPGAVGVANRLGLGPVRADLSTEAIAEAGFDAMDEVVRRLGIGAEHVLFGHTHRRGSPSGPTTAQLWNTGSWVHSPSLLGGSAAVSPYWPGTLAFVDDDGGEPELRHLLDGLTRAQLAAGH